MNNRPECDAARVQLMEAGAAGDESRRSAKGAELVTTAEAAPTAGDRTPMATAHVATCESCQQWLQAMTVMERRLDELTYPAARVDLWAGVERRIAESSQRQASVVERLWPIAGGVLVWRALLLFIDLPMPWLHPLLTFLVAVAVIWRIGGDLLTIETMAPELEKRGI